jgi:hypothetical protein
MSGMRSTKGDNTTLHNGMPSIRTRKMETQAEEREIGAQICGGSRKGGRSDRASALHNRHEEIHARGSGPENGEVTENRISAGDGANKAPQDTPRHEEEAVDEAHTESRERNTQTRNMPTQAQTKRGPQDPPFILAPQMPREPQHLDCHKATSVLEQGGGLLLGGSRNREAEKSGGGRCYEMCYIG